MRCPLLKTIAETAGLREYFQNVVQEIQVLLLMSSGCTPTLPISFIIQETFMMDSDTASPYAREWDIKKCMHGALHLPGKPGKWIAVIKRYASTVNKML